MDIGSRHRPKVLVLAAILALSCRFRAVAAPAPSVEAAPVGDLEGWRQVFVDDFAGPIELGQWSTCALGPPMACEGLPERYRGRWWAFQEGWTDGTKGVYSPARTLSAVGGVLDIHLHTEGGTPLIAAPVPLVNGPDGPLGLAYGRYAIRFKADRLPGYKIAFLLWPDSETWPRDGEIDFPEANLDGTICGFVHRRGAVAANDADGFYSGESASGAWHTAVIEWTRGLVRFLLDGEVLGASTDRIPDTPMHWVLEATTDLSGLPPDAGVSGHVLVDWVAAWAAE